MGIPFFVIDTLYLGPFSINAWGLFVSLGFLVGLLIARSRAKRLGVSDDEILDLGIISIVSAIVGSRLFYVANAWDQFAAEPMDIFRIWEGGFALYGGLIAAIAACFLYTRRKKRSFALVADAFIPGVALGEGVGRIGCFLIHDHLGRPTMLPWGIQFQGILRHETALYSIILGFLLFGLLLLAERVWKRRYAGALTHLYLLCYGVATFGIYGFRATDLPGSDPRIGPLTPSQYTAIVIFLLGAVLFIKTIVRKRLSSPIPSPLRSRIKGVSS